jgi:hypothetical protein
MKKQILSFLFVLGLGLLTVSSTFATNETQVSIGANVTYSFTTANGTWTGTPAPVYTWRVLTGGSGTTVAVAPTDYTSILASATSNSITWNKAGTYRIEIVAVDANGCISEPFYKTITVTDAVLCIAPSAGTVGGTTVAAPTITTTCSLIATNTSGNGTGSAGSDITEFYATITGATANRNYTIIYSVGGVNSATTATINTDATGAGAVKISVNTTDWAAAFTNDSSGDQNATIAVVSMSDGSWTSTNSNLCALPSFNVVVKPTPTINF